MPVLGKDSDGQRHWVIEWIAHHWYAYWLGAYFLSVGNSALGDNGWLVAGGLIIFFGWIIVYQRVMYIHRFGLCLRCIELAPLDPEVKIKKHDRELRFTHRLGDVRTTLAWIIFGWLTWMSIITNTVGLVMPPGSVLAQAIYLPIAWTPMLLLERSTRIHNWLHPWCPYCRWDDGGEHEEAPDPVPSGTIDRDDVNA